MNKNDADDVMLSETAENSSDASVELTETSVDTNNAGGDETVEFTDGAPVEEMVAKPEVDEKKINTKAFSDRLKAEKQKIKAEEERVRVEEMDKLAKRQGFDTWKELDEFSKKETLQNLGISDPDSFKSYLDEAIANNPAVVQARNIIESQKQNESQAIIDAAIEQIHSFDEDINSVEDLTSLENYDEFYSLVEKGYSLTDAYKVISFDKVAQKRVAKATQSVMTNIDSKGHLKTTSGEKAKEVAVPEDVFQVYKKNFPNMSYEEIQKSYAKYNSGK